MNVQSIKQRFGIIGNAHGLNRAIDIAAQVAPTDLSVLITGESGTGKEIIPQIIHSLSSRKHNHYIAVNCGAIPEGTIDSELFGHEKGSFTGAYESRKGYFEEANGGTIFLDEVGELPLSTQVRLLRVLEAGEYIRVGSSKVQKTDVRVIAATNMNIPKSINDNKFREDLYYRLNTVPITVPPLRTRREDIFLLFRKFAQDFSEKYRMPAIRLNESAQNILSNYPWPGNIRQLKNITEQISIIEQQREIDAEILSRYLPENVSKNLPALFSGINRDEFSSEREILYKILFDMRNEVNDLKNIVKQVINSSSKSEIRKDISMSENINNDFSQEYFTGQNIQENKPYFDNLNYNNNSKIEEPEEFSEESLSLENIETEMIKKALEKHKGKRKYAARELGISERTLYRKIKEHNLG
jgi:transcriptional regulator with PAS, ATPase and Fis domain